jgi:protein-disulfide isomerase
MTINNRIMSTKHNISIIVLLAGGLALVLFFAWATIKEGRKNNTKNPYQGITRPQSFRESPVEGAEDGRIVIFEFGDYLCTHCQEVQGVMEQIFVKYGDRVRHVWKDFAFVSEESKRAAAAARCAQAQGKFWQYHDWLFKNQKDLGKLSYQQGARELGLAVDKFTACLSAGDEMKLVERDFLEGQALGVEETPLFVVGERAFTGVVEFADFERVVLQEMGRIK